MLLAVAEAVCHRFNYSSVHVFLSLESQQALHPRIIYAVNGPTITDADFQLPLTAKSLVTTAFNSQTRIVAQDAKPIRIIWRTLF